MRKPPAEPSFHRWKQRTAITATAVFYEMNGFALRFRDLDLYDWLIRLYNSGRVNKQSLDEWFRSHIERL